MPGYYLSVEVSTAFGACRRTWHTAKKRLQGQDMTRLKTAGKFLALTATALGCALACAQTPTTLKGAVERAILQNPEVKYRFHNLEAAQKNANAEGAWFPRVD